MAPVPPESEQEVDGATDAFFDRAVEELFPDATALGDAYNIEKKATEDTLETMIAGTGRVRSDSFRQLMDLIDRSDETERMLLFKKLEEHLATDPDPNVRGACASLLAQFGKEGIEDLVRALHTDAARSVRETAAYGLGRCGGEDEIRHLYEAVQQDQGAVGVGRSIARSAVGSIGRVGGEDAASLLRDIWQSERGTDVGDLALSAMGSAGMSSNLSLLENVLNDPEASGRSGAVYALESIACRNRDDTRVVERVRSVLRDHIHEHDPRLVGRIATALGMIGTSEDIEMLEELLDHPYVRDTMRGGKLITECYPVRESARAAIDMITSRLASQK